MKHITLAIIEYSGGTIYASDEFYCTWNGDSPSNRLFVDRLVSCEYERAVTFYWWQRTQPSASIKFLDLNNQDGYFDALLSGDWANTRVTLYKVARGAAFSAAVQVGTFLVRPGGVVTPDRATFRLEGKSYLDALDKAINAAYSSSVTNPQVRSQQKPVTLGDCRWVPPVNHRLNEPSGSVRGAYDVADGPFEGIVELRYRGAASTEALSRFITGSQYFPVQDASEAYGFLFGVQDYKLAAQTLGQLRLDDNSAANADFAIGSGGYPDAWTPDETDGTVSWSPGSVTIVGGGSGSCGISQVLPIVASSVYYVTVEIDALTGVLQIFEVGGAVLAEVDSSSGPFSFSFVGSANAEIGVGFATGSSGTATLTGVYVYPAHRINVLSEVVQFAAERCGLGPGDLDFTSFAIVEAAAGNPVIAFHGQGDEVNGKQLVTETADCYSACVWQDRFGLLKAVRLASPSSLSADYTLYLEDVDGVIERETDDAPSLTTKILYNENYAVHTDDDMAGLPASVSGAPAIRADLSRQFSTVESAVSPHSTYADAVGRQGHKCLLQEQSDAQAKADYDVGLFSSPMAFWTCVARRIEGADLFEIEPGDVIQVFGDRYGLDSGKKMFVVYAKNDLVGDKIEMSLWG